MTILRWLGIHFDTLTHDEVAHWLLTRTVRCPTCGRGKR